jgi:hypothetical protein
MVVFALASFNIACHWSVDGILACNIGVPSIYLRFEDVKRLKSFMVMLRHASNNLPVYPKIPSPGGHLIPMST